jgi:hypothetical protein
MKQTRRLETSTFVRLKTKTGGVGKIVGENPGDNGKATQLWNVKLYPSGETVAKTLRQLKILQEEDVDAATRQIYEPRQDEVTVSGLLSNELFALTTCSHQIPFFKLGSR